MAWFRRRRKPVVKRLPRRRAAPLLAEPMGQTRLARRVNRLGAVVALFGAVGAFALAVALTPGTQPSRSSAKASQDHLAVSEIKPQPIVAAEASPAAPVLAALPQPAAKSDRLSLSFRAPQPAAADRLSDTRSLRRPGRDNVSEPDTAITGETAGSASKAAAIHQADLETDFDVEPSDSAASGTVVDVDTGDEAGALEIDEASAEAIEQVIDEVIDQARDEASDEASDDAAPATRSAAVTTDVNMRAGPDNSAAVILVVPGKSDVEVIGCDYWCEVVFAGKRGWIYKGFVRGAES